MSRKILGLDIRNESITAVLIESSLKGNFIEACGHVPVAEQENGSSTVEEALSAITEHMDISGATCIASFPVEKVTFRNIQVPFKERKKIKQVLPFELEPTLPLPVEDFHIEFFPLKALPAADHVAELLQEQSEYTDLVVAAIENDILEAYLGNLAFIGINPHSVTPGGYLTALCLAHSSNVPNHWILIEVNQKSCTLFFVVFDQIHILRSFPLYFNEPSCTQMLITEIERMISALEENSSILFEPKHIYIAGVDEEAEIEEQLERFLDISVTKVNLLRDMDVTYDTMPEGNFRPGVMDSALALAMAGIVGINGLNFHKVPFAAVKYFIEYKQKIIKTSVLAGLTTILFISSVLIDSYSMEKEIQRFNSTRNEIFQSTFPGKKDIKDQLKQMSIMRNEVEAVRNIPVLSTEMEHSIRTVDILNDISNLIPKKVDIEVTNFVISTDNVQISGNTDTFESVDEIKSSLEKSKYFKKVTISNAKALKSKAGRGDRVGFKISLDINK